MQHLLLCLGIKSTCSLIEQQDGRAAQKRTDPAAVLGGTYKAITFAMRAGYATAQEKIAKGVEKITRLLGDVKSNTSDMADNLDFDTV